MKLFLDISPHKPPLQATKVPLQYQEYEHGLTASIIGMQCVQKIAIIVKYHHRHPQVECQILHRPVSVNKNVGKCHNKN